MSKPCETNKPCEADNKNCEVDKSVFANKNALANNSLYTQAAAKAFAKYLQGYAEPAAQQCVQAGLAKLLAQTRQQHLAAQRVINAPQHYSHTLIIPAYNESTAFIRRLLAQQFLGCARLLVIVVVNQPAQKHTRRTTLNQRLFDYCRSQGAHGAITLDGGHQFTQHPQSLCDFLLVNGCEPAINPKQGVGYARKLGCDIAVYLMQQQLLEYQWLYCSDADATLPRHYFDTPQPVATLSALTYEFSHQFLPKAQGFYQARTQRVNAIYEHSILAYRNGLQASGSPYGFCTLGSAMAANPLRYCQVRGFPKRAAGEDFYLLNKLAKLAPIKALPQIITLKPRASLRVPFGTGPAVNQLLKQGVFVDYDPKVYVHLKEALEFLPRIFTPLKTHGLTPTTLEHLFEQAKLSPQTQEALYAIGVQKLLVHMAKQAQNSEQAQRIIYEWFDGFRTLKFIHALTQGPYPKIVTRYCSQ